MTHAAKSMGPIAASHIVPQHTPTTAQPTPHHATLPNLPINEPLITHTSGCSYLPLTIPYHGTSTHHALPSVAVCVSVQCRVCGVADWFERARRRISAQQPRSALPDGGNVWLAQLNLSPEHTQQSLITQSHSTGGLYIHRLHTGCHSNSTAPAHKCWYDVCGDELRASE